MLWFKPHARFRLQLSAFIDGRLSERERQGLEAHLQACPACRRQLEELRAMVAALRSLPLEQAPRSFALRPQQVAQRPRPSAVGGLALPMRLASAGLAAALAVLLVVDIADLGGNEEVAAPAAAPVEQPLEAPAPEPAPAAAEEFRAEPAPDAEALGREPAEMAPEPLAEREAVAAEDGGGLGALRLAQITLAAALGALLIASIALIYIVPAFGPARSNRRKE